MKKLFLSIAITFLSLTAVAGGQIQGSLGYTGGTMVLGFEYEHMLNNKNAYVGHIYFATDDPNLINIGFLYKLTVPRGDWRFSISAGLGIYMYDQGNESEIKFGPEYKIASLRELSDNLAIGLEFVNMYSWFTDISFGASLSNFVVQYKFD